MPKSNAYMITDGTFSVQACGRISSAVLAGLLMLGAAPSQTPPAVHQVLVLQSFDRGNLAIDHFTGSFRVELDRRAGRPLNVVQVVVGPAGSVGAPEQAIVDYIGSIFTDGRTPDLIVTVAGPAAVFARKYRQQLFPETPLLFASVDERYLSDAPLGDHEAAVAVVNDFPGLVEDILRLRPQTRRVFMVMGYGRLGQFWRRQLDDQFRRFDDRLTFVWSNDLSLPEIVRQCASLPDDSAILYLSFGTDVVGGAYADERVVEDLHDVASVPMFSAHDVMLGRGVVGGSVMRIDDLGRSTADVALRILNGAPPGSVRVPPQLRGPAIFDWRELQRWGIPESRLPPGSTLQYRGPTLWREYRPTVLTALGLLAIQSVLIIGLLYQRRARQRAEIESRRNLALAADASRRQTMSALTGSIAHELSQPLTALTLNAKTLQWMVTTNPAADPIAGILSDIQAQCSRASEIVERHRTMLRAHQLDKKPIDLGEVIREGLALVVHQLRAWHVETTVDLPATPCAVDGDQVLLQQVLVNLVMNAIDAMAETPRPRRRLTISVDVRRDVVAVSVQDTGTGLPPHVAETLFAPFVTTRPNGIGIGLTIARTILDAHGGTIVARNNPDGGATFTLTLRRRDAGEVWSGESGAA